MIIWIELDKLFHRINVGAASIHSYIDWYMVAWAAVVRLLRPLYVQSVTSLLAIGQKSGQYRRNSLVEYGQLVDPPSIVNIVHMIPTTLRIIPRLRRIDPPSCMRRPTTDDDDLRSFQSVHHLAGGRSGQIMHAVVIDRVQYQGLELRTEIRRHLEEKVTPSSEDPRPRRPQRPDDLQEPGGHHRRGMTPTTTAARVVVHPPATPPRRHHHPVIREPIHHAQPRIRPLQPRDADRPRGR